MRDKLIASNDFSLFHSHTWALLSCNYYIYIYFFPGESTHCSNFPNACTNEELDGYNGRWVTSHNEQSSGGHEGRTEGDHVLLALFETFLLYLNFSIYSPHFVQFLDPFLLTYRLHLALQGERKDQNRGSNLQTRVVLDLVLEVLELRIKQSNSTIHPQSLLPLLARPQFKN